jgi:L-iditol 2-dehydrogenase
MEKNSMKSLVLLEPRKFELKEVDIPEYGCNDVLIKVVSAAICHTDFTVIEGQHSWSKYPCVLGHEFSGIVENFGAGVDHVKKGDRVVAMGYSYCGVCPACQQGFQNGCRNMKGIPFHMDGAYQEFVAVPARIVYPISDSISMEEAALIEPAANGYAAADRANIQPGESVVIIGPGPVGLLSLQFAKLKQPQILIMNGTREERLNLASKFGATHTINVKEEDPFKKIMDITDGNGVNTVLFCGGEQDAWEMAESILTPFGRVVIEALPAKYDSRWPVTVSKFTEKSISFLGIGGYSAQQFATALKLVENKKIDVLPLITHRFPLENFKEAFETSKERKSGALRVLFNIGF